MEIAVGRELFFFPAIIIGGMCLLGLLGWLYEKTRKKVQHPRLGTLTFYSESWSGRFPHFQGNGQTLRFELPGSKAGPKDEDIERFEAFWIRVPQLLELIRPHAVEEFEALRDSDDDSEEEAEVKAIAARIEADPKSFDLDWSLAGIGLHRGDTHPWYWCLEFDVSWDAEHTRSAYLDLDGQFLLYDLSCAVVDL